MGFRRPAFVSAVVAVYDVLLLIHHDRVLKTNGINGSLQFGTLGLGRFWEDAKWISAWIHE